MGSTIKEILIGIPVVCFVFWVFTAPLPQTRIERVCQPIHWVGNVVTSTTALTTDNHTATSVRWSDKLNYSCQYMVWRLFYQEEYNEAVKAGLVRPAADSEQAQDAPTAEKTTTLPSKGKEAPLPDESPSTPEGARK